ncbi:hypothetical protein C8R43DRAFT_947198 [Mycena crocata]|nr:hypothetical protein C8R43DRAFT_947198 [Mycena crocata]
MASRYLQRLVEAGADALAFAKYKTDFVPFEDAHVGPTDRAGNGDTRGYPSLMMVSGRREVFVGMAFGEVAEITEVDNERGFFVRIRCPSNLSCLAEYAYYQQLETLQNIINEDELYTGWIPGNSWWTCEESTAPEADRSLCIASQVNPATLILCCRDTSLKRNLKIFLGDSKDTAATTGSLVVRDVAEAQDYCRTG